MVDYDKWIAKQIINRASHQIFNCLECGRDRWKHNHKIGWEECCFRCWEEITDGL